MSITLSYHSIETALRVLGYSASQLSEFKQKFLQTIVQSIGIEALSSLSTSQQQELFHLLEDPQVSLQQLIQVLGQFIPEKESKALKETVVKKLLTKTFENILKDISEKQKKEIFEVLSKS